MNTLVETPNTNGTHPDGTVLNRVRRYFGGRRGLILLVLAVIGAGFALNWSWLVAVGVAPVLLAIAPCAAMCALGLCMNKMGGKSCSDKSGPDNSVKSVNKGANDE